MKPQRFCTKESWIFKEVKELDPIRIDWSNIPDYLGFSEFFSMALKCSGNRTEHSFYLMNWLNKVYGCDLVDYVDVKENYHRPDFNPQGQFKDSKGVLKKLMKSLRGKFIAKKSRTKVPSFLNMDVNSLTMPNISEMLLSEKFAGTFMRYMFDRDNVMEKQWKKRPFALIKRANTIVDASFIFEL